MHADLVINKVNVSLKTFHRQFDGRAGIVEEALEIKK